MPCWFCKWPGYSGEVEHPDMDGVCDRCKALLADFRAWLHDPERRAAEARPRHRQESSPAPAAH